MSEPTSREGTQFGPPPPPFDAPPPPFDAPPPPGQQYGFTGPTPPPTAGGTGGPPSWNPPPGSTPPGGNKFPWIPFAVMGGVAVLLLGALGIFLLVTPDDEASGPTTPMTSTKPTSERTSPSRTRTTEARPPDDPDSFGATLLTLIPQGYPTSVCEVADPPAPGALATVDCGLSTQPGGPHAARYSLFADADQLSQHFTESVAANEETFRCPGGNVDSPADWNYERTPDVVAGQVACGTFQGNADVVWTQNDDLVLADVQSQDIDELHNWWLNYS